MEKRVQPNYKGIINSIEYLNNSLKHTFKDLQYKPDQIKKICEFSETYRYGAPKPDWSELTGKASDLASEHIVNYVREIRKSRASLREIDSISAIEQAGRDSRNNSGYSLSEAFPSASFDVDVGDAAYSPSDRYGSDGTITVPLTWDKKVRERGIDVVKAGDGNRFIVNCYPRKLSRLAKENIEAFSVVAIKRHAGAFDMIDATVMKYDAGGTSVCSIADTFARAESLIRRRIKDVAIDTLLEL